MSKKLFYRKFLMFYNANNILFTSELNNVAKVQLRSKKITNKLVRNWNQCTLKILQTAISIVVLISPFFLHLFSPYKIPILLFIPRWIGFRKIDGCLLFAEPIRLFILFPSFLFLSPCLILCGVWTRGQLFCESGALWDLQIFGQS